MMDPKDYCTMYIARHGQTESNIKNDIHNHSDSPLTEVGISQAKELGRLLKNIHFDVVFSSDFFRAHHTAQIAIQDRELAVQTSKFLREKRMGYYEHRDHGEYRAAVKNIIAQMKIVSASDRAKLKVSYDEESEEEANGRFITFLREIAVTHINKNVFIVSHGGVIRMLLTHLGFATRKELLGAVSNTAYVKILSDGVDFFIEETVGINKNVISI